MKSDPSKNNNHDLKKVKNVSKKMVLKKKKLNFGIIKNDKYSNINLNRFQAFTPVLTDHTRYRDFFSDKKNQVEEYSLFDFQKKQNNNSQKLLQWGAHIGHKPLRLGNSNKRAFYPAIIKYLTGARKKLNYIDTLQTIKQTMEAIYTITCILKKGGCILIVNTNIGFNELTQIQENRNILTTHYNSQKLTTPIKKFVDSVLWKKTKKRVVESFNFLNSYAEQRQFMANSGTSHLIQSKAQANILKNSGAISFTQYKWVGGTLSNWNQISKTVWRVAKFSQQLEKFLKSHYITFPRYLQLEKSFQGLIREQNTNICLGFQKKPDLILLINSIDNLSAVREANSLRIPVMALADSHTNLTGISYAIPVNNESIYYFFQFLNLIIKINNKARFHETKFIQYKSID